MLLQRSRLAAAATERPRLAPPWSIAVLGAMVLLALIAIYPHEALIKRVVTAPPGEITNAYLNNLLRTEPEDPRLRLLLARSEMLAGQYEQVAHTIAPALVAPDQALRREAFWLLWQNDERLYLSMTDDARLRPQRRQELRAQLGAIADQQWPQEILAEMARKAVAFGDLPLALRLFKRLGAHGAYGYGDAARAALADGEYRAAAEFYLIAREHATSVAEQRSHFFAAMHALESGDQLAEALKIAEDELQKAPDLAADQQTLILLVRFARAARRPDLADKYARRLLRISLLEQWRRQQLAARAFDLVVQRVAANAQTLRGEPQLPFDDAVYALGFAAFIDNRELEDAWKVAASAVRQAPENLAWRERLARVSEWTGKAQLALDNWLVIARASGRDAAWQNVLRLAPGLFDDAALRAALRYQLARQPDDEKLLREVAATYERLGDPQGALHFLEETHRRNGQTWLLQEMAQLAERAGDDALALHYWQGFLAKAALTPALAVHIATLLLLHGEPEEGLALLEQAQATAGDGDIAFWRLGAALAQLVQNERSAIGAYRHVVGSPESEARDYDALLALLHDDYPLEAAQTAVAAWSRFRRPAHLVQALGHYAAGARWPEMGRLFGELDGPQLQALRRQSDFLQLSAQYFLNSGQLALARRDLETAVQLAPDASDVQLALLWLLIEAGDGAAVRRALATWEGDWRDNPTRHDALAAAYLALSLPDIALRRYLSPHLAAHRDDFLWLMNYADALEQNQEVDRAWRLREYLLARQRAAGELRRDEDASASDALRRAARARLLIAQRPGDPALTALRELLRVDRDGRNKLSAGARDLALGWLQEAAEYPAERGWLWQQYARTAARPAAAEISLALAENDRVAAGQLLEEHGDALPRHDRVDAARLFGDVRGAQSDAFATQTRQGADDALQLQLDDALLAHSNQLGGERVRRDLGGIIENERSAHWHLAISPRLTLDLALGSIARSNRDTAAIGSTPDESYRSARLVWRDGDGETRLTGEQRASFANYHPLLVEHEQRIDDRVLLKLALGSALPASDSIPLRIGGMKDHAALGLRYRPTLRDQIEIEHSWDRYFAQTGSRLGQGQVWQVEAAHALRLEARDLEAGVFWSSQRYARHNDFAELGALVPADAGSDFFLPDDFRYYGVRLSTDTRFASEYTRAWRPYASIAKTWNTALGPGYELAAGIAGSVFGADHLSFGWQLGKGGANAGGIVREIGLIYRIYY